MPLQNASILDGASISATGGTSVTLSTDGLQVPSGIHLIDASVTDYRARPNVTCRNKVPVIQPDGTYGKGRRSTVLAFPKVLESGKQGFPCVRIELEDFPEMSVAEIDKMLNWAAQVLTDPDFVSFWRTGSLA